MPECVEEFNCLHGFKSVFFFWYFCNLLISSDHPICFHILASPFSCGAHPKATFCHCPWCFLTSRINGQGFNVPGMLSHFQASWTAWRVNILLKSKGAKIGAGRALSGGSHKKQPSPRWLEFMSCLIATVKSFPDPIFVVSVRNLDQTPQMFSLT